MGAVGQVGPGKQYQYANCRSPWSFGALGTSGALGGWKSPVSTSRMGREVCRQLSDNVYRISLAF